MYDLLRSFADSWALVALVALFVGIVFWAFRPGTKDLHEDLASIPLRNDEIKE